MLVRFIIILTISLLCNRAFSASAETSAMELERDIRRPIKIYMPCFLSSFKPEIRIETNGDKWSDIRISISLPEEGTYTLRPFRQNDCMDFLEICKRQRSLKRLVDPDNSQEIGMDYKRFVQFLKYKDSELFYQGFMVIDPQGRSIGYSLIDESTDCAYLSTFIDPNFLNLKCRKFELTNMLDSLMMWHFIPYLVKNLRFKKPHNEINIYFENIGLSFVFNINGFLRSKWCVPLIQVHIMPKIAS